MITTCWTPSAEVQCDCTLWSLLLWRHFCSVGRLLLELESTGPRMDTSCTRQKEGKSDQPPPSSPSSQHLSPLQPPSLPLSSTSFSPAAHSSPNWSPPYAIPLHPLSYPPTYSHQYLLQPENCLPSSSNPLTQINLLLSDFFSPLQQYPNPRNLSPSSYPLRSTVSDKIVVLWVVLDGLQNSSLKRFKPVLRIRHFFLEPDPLIRFLKSGSGSYLDMFLMLSKIWHFLTKSKHLMILKIKDNIGRNCILYDEKIIITFLWIEDPDPDLCDPKNPDPTWSGSATLV